MKAITITLSALTVIGSATMAMAGTLGPGDKAPAIQVKQWLKGDPINAFESKGIYVVEFWATWCPPCRASIPHLTELAHKYKGQVRVLGVSIWQNDETAEDVKKFVDDHGDKMDYTIAYGGGQDAVMAKTWMQAGGQMGIPTAFIVKDRVIQWVGMPQNIDQPIAGVTAGTWDVLAARQKCEKLTHEDRAALAETNRLREAPAVYDRGDKERARTIIAHAEKTLKGDWATNVASIKLSLLAREEPTNAMTEIDRLLKTGNQNDLYTLWSFAYDNATTPSTSFLAEYCVKRGLRLDDGKNFDAHQMAHYFYGLRKEYDRAIQIIDEMLEMLDKNLLKDEEDSRGELIKNRADYVKQRDAAKKKTK